MQHGPEWLGNDRVLFRLWAPSAISVSLLLEADTPLPMQPVQQGWYERSEIASAGQRYCFVINDAMQVPDPASRFQPEESRIWSELIAPSIVHDGWKGRPWEETVIYELHVGTFSPQGTYAGVEARLDYLQALGITAIELMPISDFAGIRGWGYDGVLPYAPERTYGRPEELKQLIQSAHSRGIMVFLDVVYNHFGPEGNYLNTYANAFFTNKHSTPWGDAVDFSVPQVRNFFIQNALYWLEEFGFDGLRLDAVHAILDHSEMHFLDELASILRSRFLEHRLIHLVIENENNEPHYLERHFNAQWNDPLHHALHVLLTGETHGYYEDYAQHCVQVLGRSLTQGVTYEENGLLHRNKSGDGRALTVLSPSAFVCFIQNHDHIGNRAFGERISLLAQENALHMVYALLLLSPQIPLLFMGEEWATRTPFLFFCDFSGELASAVCNGRRDQFARFGETVAANAPCTIPDPNHVETFTRCILNWQEQAQLPYALFLVHIQALLQLRQLHIWPLLKTRCLSASYECVGEGGLDATWSFEGEKRLRLIANFSDHQIETFRPLQGSIVWGDANPSLGAWTCVWSIEHV